MVESETEEIKVGGGHYYIDGRFAWHCWSFSGKDKTWCVLSKTRTNYESDRRLFGNQNIQEKIRDEV